MAAQTGSPGGSSSSKAAPGLTGCIRPRRQPAMRHQPPSSHGELRGGQHCCTCSSVRALVRGCRRWHLRLESRAEACGAAADHDHDLAMQRQRGAGGVRVDGAGQHEVVADLARVPCGAADALARRHQQPQAPARPALDPVWWSKSGRLRCTLLACPPWCTQQLQAQNRPAPLHVPLSLCAALALLPLEVQHGCMQIMSQARSKACGGDRGHASPHMGACAAEGEAGCQMPVLDREGNETGAAGLSTHLMSLSSAPGTMKCTSKPDGASGCDSNTCGRMGPVPVSTAGRG